MVGSLTAISAGPSIAEHRNYLPPSSIDASLIYIYRRDSLLKCILLFSRATLLRQLSRQLQLLTTVDLGLSSIDFELLEPPQNLSLGSPVSIGYHINRSSGFDAGKPTTPPPLPCCDRPVTSCRGENQLTTPLQAMR